MLRQLQNVQGLVPKDPWCSRPGSSHLPQVSRPTVTHHALRCALTSSSGMPSPPSSRAHCSSVSTSLRLAPSS